MTWHPQRTKPIRRVPPAKSIIPKAVHRATLVMIEDKRGKPIGYHDPGSGAVYNLRGHRRPADKSRAYDKLRVAAARWKEREAARVAEMKDRA